MDKNISRAIRHMKTVTALAKELDVTPQAVCFWRDKKRKVPVEKCTAIERVTNGLVTRKDLRPRDYRDIWPELAEKDDQ